jgi:hypothetical protein
MRASRTYGSVRAKPNGLATRPLPVHPLQLVSALEKMKAQDSRAIAAAVRQVFPGPSYELVSASNLAAAVSASLTAQQRKPLERGVWRGTIAAVAYYETRWHSTSTE